MAEKETLLSAEHVTLAYDGKVVAKDLSFALTGGEYVCVVGENGSGKSTLLKALTGILRPAAGRIRRREGLRLGYLPQQSAIQRDFPASVEEVVLSGCRESRFLPGFFWDRRDRARAASALARLGMETHAADAYHALSGGQQQRVLLARALCASETLLLLDEPVTGLDPAAAREMYGCIRALNGAGTTILMVTHDMEAALEEASHILCLCQRHGGTNEPGSAVFYGTVAAYREQLTHGGCACCGERHAPGPAASARRQILPPQF